MSAPKIASKEEWLAARKELLAKEKELSHTRERIAELRRELPWVRVDKEYAFQGESGNVTLADLFDGRSQLLVYHFMFGPDWEEGCKSCSFLTDHFQGALPHLGARDVAFATVSRAPLEKLLAFRERMGWKQTWVSSLHSDFNFDYQASFTPEEMESKSCYYNFTQTAFPASEAPGMSVFAKNGDDIYHTYSVYARGLDNFIGAYQLLDLVPKGRDEKDLDYSMAWVRHHDRYE